MGGAGWDSVFHLLRCSAPDFKYDLTLVLMEPNSGFDGNATWWLWWCRFSCIKGRTQLAMVRCGVWYWLSCATTLIDLLVTQWQRPVYQWQRPPFVLCISALFTISQLSLTHHLLFVFPSWTSLSVFLSSFFLLTTWLFNFYLSCFSLTLSLSFLKTGLCSRFSKSIPSSASCERVLPLSLIITTNILNLNILSCIG